MHRDLFALLLLLSLPLTVLGAGFAKQSLFLSASPVVEGDSVLIYAVVQNDADAAFSGSVVFFAQKDGGGKQKVGSTAASIAAHGANTVSVSWQPAAGSYAVSAELTASDNTVVESQTENFTINAKPEPASDSSVSGVQSSAEVAAMLAQYAPPLAGAAGPLFSAIDSFREQAASLIDQGLNWSKTHVGANPNPGAVLGEATKNTSPQGIWATLSALAAMLAFYFFTLLKWIVADTGVFYPVVAITFLFALWRVFARIRRPRY